MSIRLNVLIVHGIGTGEDGPAFARPLEQHIGRVFDRAIRRLKLRDVKGSDSRAKNALRFQPVFWSPITQQPQDALLKLMFGRFRPFARINLMYRLRRSMIALAGDVIAYERNSKNPVYQEIHGMIDARVEALGLTADDMLPGGYAPLTLVGHSLGSVIISDYVWDRTRGETHLLEDQHLTLTNFVMMGSPMVLYALRGNAGGGMDSIRDALGSPIRVDPEHGLWVNLYDPNDPIAFPLTKVDSYRKAGVIDRSVRAGNWLTGRTALSHTGYWQCDDAAQIIGEKLALDWARLNSAQFTERAQSNAGAALAEAIG